MRLKMTLEKMIQLLNEDLSNEYAHWNFYLQSATNVRGLHREEVHEFLLKEAQGEMEHIESFKRLIIGLGGEPRCQSAPFEEKKYDPRSIFEEALRMEDGVVARYVERLEDAQQLYAAGDRVNGKYIELFMEDQIMDSRGDADHIREMVRNF